MSENLTFDLWARDHASSTFDRFGRNVSSSNKAVGTLKLGLGSLARGFIALGVAYKAADFFKQSISEASDLNETINKTKVIFGQTAKGILRWSQDSATALGLSRNEALAAASDFGNMFDQLGFGADQVTKMSKGVVQMAADLGSFNNLPTDDVIERIAGGFRGEYDALQKLIPNISAARVETEALALSGKKSADNLNAQEKAAAVLSIVQKDGARAMGDFARTSGGLANQSKILSAQWDNLQAQVGTMLLPVMTKLATLANDVLVPALADISSWVGEHLVPMFANLGAAFSGTKGEGDKLSQGLRDYAQAARDLYDDLRPIVEDVVAAVRRNWPEIQRTIGSTLSATAEAISAFAELVGALWDRFGDEILLSVGTTWKNAAVVIRAALRIISAVVRAVTAIIKGDWKGAWNAMEAIPEQVLKAIHAVMKNSFDALIGIVSNFGGWLGGKISDAWAKARNATMQGVGKVVAYVRSLPGKVKAAVGDLGALLFDAGQQVVQGLIDGIKSKASEVAGAASSLGDIAKNSVKSVLGIQSPSKVMKGLGEDTGQGFSDGIREKVKETQQAARDMAQAVVREARDAVRAVRSEMSQVFDTVQGSFFESAFGQGFGDVDTMRTFARSQLNNVKRLVRDVRKLIGWGLSRDLVSQMVNSGDFQGIHELATSSRADVRTLNRVNAQTQRGLDQISRMVGQELYGDVLAQRKKDLREAVRDGYKDALRELRDHRRDKAHDLARGTAA